MYAHRVASLVFLSALALLLAGCNSRGATTEPTQDTGPIYTAAAQTFTAQQTEAAQGTPIVVPSSTSPGVAEATDTALPPTNTPVPTATPLPTNTPLPTATATNPPPTATFTATPNPRVSSGAAFLSTPPHIDGTWDEWTTT